MPFTKRRLATTLQLVVIGAIGMFLPSTRLHVLAFSLITIRIPYSCLRNDDNNQHIFGGALGAASSGRSDYPPAVVSDPPNIPPRRQFIFQTGQVAASWMALGTFMMMPEPVKAVMQNSQTVFKVGKELTVPEAKARFKEGQTSLQYLLDHFDEIIANGGGDNVRRYLGTVGTSSGLYGIQKVMKRLQEEADDIVEYTETMNEVNAAITGADGSSYMAIFTTSSTSNVAPEKYFGDAKIEACRASKAMETLSKQLQVN